MRLSQHPIGVSKLGGEEKYWVGKTRNKWVGKFSTQKKVSAQKNRIWVGK